MQILSYYTGKVSPAQAHDLSPLARQVLISTNFIKGAALPNPYRVSPNTADSGDCT